MKKFLFFIFLLHPIHSYADKLKLPITLSCTEKAGGGLQKQNGQWIAQKFHSNMDFKISVYNYNTVTGIDKGHCETASIAAGKQNDEYSKFRRSSGNDVCAVITLADKQQYGSMGPILKYCKLSDPNILSCEDFALDTERLIFFDVAPATIGLRTDNVPVTFGTCQYIR